jgi:hypothetical protein
VLTLEDSTTPIRTLFVETMRIGREPPICRIVASGPMSFTGATRWSGWHHHRWRRSSRRSGRALERHEVMGFIEGLTGEVRRPR